MSRRGPRKATAAYLRNSALAYLERYASSVANLRRLLTAKVRRSARVHGTDATAGLATVDAILDEFVRHGALDDARYARGQALSLHRRGASARAIRSRLAAKSVAADAVDQALAGLREEAADPDLAAAVTFARRRRLGPYRPAARADNRARDLAALGRQGFPYDLARRVVEARDSAALEAEVADECGRRHG